MSGNTSQNANLGCGTLILIAIIVSIFGNSRGELESEISGLRKDVKALTQEVQDLRTQLQGQPDGPAADNGAQEKVSGPFFGA